MDRSGPPLGAHHWTLNNSTLSASALSCGIINVVVASSLWWDKDLPGHRLYRKIHLTYSTAKGWQYSCWKYQQRETPRQGVCTKGDIFSSDSLHPNPPHSLSRSGLLAVHRYALEYSLWLARFGGLEFEHYTESMRQLLVKHQWRTRQDTDVHSTGLPRYEAGSLSALDEFTDSTQTGRHYTNVEKPLNTVLYETTPLILNSAFSCWVWLETVELSTRRYLSLSLSLATQGQRLPGSALGGFSVGGFERCFAFSITCSAVILISSGISSSSPGRSMSVPCMCLPSSFENNQANNSFHVCSSTTYLPLVRLTLLAVLLVSSSLQMSALSGNLPCFFPFAFLTSPLFPSPQIHTSLSPCAGMGLTLDEFVSFLVPFYSPSSRVFPTVIPEPWAAWSSIFCIWCLGITSIGFSGHDFPLGRLFEVSRGEPHWTLAPGKGWWLWLCLLILAYHVRCP